MGLFLYFPREKIKLLNKLNFCDTAVDCFPVRNVLDSFEIRLLLYISPISAFTGFTSARLFTADTESPF